MEKKGAVIPAVDADVLVLSLVVEVDKVVLAVELDALVVNGVELDVLAVDE